MPALQHLIENYDEDGDGHVSRREYLGDDLDFVRLDRDGDGTLSASDFEKRGRRVAGARAEEERQLRAAFLAAAYLQIDEHPERLDLSEHLRALSLYDRNGDGRVGRSEFEAKANEIAAKGAPPGPKWAGLLERETTDPWETLLGPMDSNDDGFLTSRELSEFHLRARAQGVWKLVDGAALASQRAQVGETAPDFVLSSADGRTSVRLSEQRGKLVGLIFGSFT